MRSFRDIPIKQKLMAIIMSIAATALLFSGVALILSDVILFRRGLQRDLSALTQIVADTSTAAVAFDDPQAAEEILEALKARTHVVAACIFRQDETLLARYSRSGTPSKCGPPAASESGVQFTSAAVTMVRPILLKDRRIGNLVLVYDLGEMYERMRLYGAIVLSVSLVSSLIAFLLSSKLRAIIATPISQLAYATALVSKTRDYSIRAQKISGDELGVLVEGFNGMLASIQSRDNELRDALEARETALQEAHTARDFLRTTLASIGDAVISTDVEGRVVFANPVACRLMRYEENEIAGRPLDESLRLVNERTRARVESPAARVLREGTIVGLANHTVLVARDGTEVPIDDSAAPIRNHQGDLVGIVLIFRDITERRRAEQELSSTREQLQLVTDTMAPAVTHCSRDLRYLWVSRRYAEWLESSAEAIAGRSIRDVVGREAMDIVQPYIERVLRGERVEYEALVNFRSIGPRWIRAVYVPTYDHGGEVTGWVADVADITALKNAEAEVARINADLQKSNERLARSNEDLANFAFVASHDLQEPLRIVTTYAQLLVRGYPVQLDGEAQMFVRNIVDGAKRMRGLLSDLLAYSEIGDEPEAAMQTVDLKLVLESVRQNLKVAVEESGAEITAEDLPVIAGYTGHFVQLFQNLVGNAIKYRGERAPRIHIRCQKETGLLRFAVTDNGIGIDPQYHGKIFGVFKRLHGKKIPGTGIGLAICQRIVEQYHGRIWVESEEGRGATFLFTMRSDTAASKEETNAQ